MTKHQAVQPKLLQTLLVRPGSQGRFEVVADGRKLGTSQNEMMAIWTAVIAAEEIAKRGCLARVIVQRGNCQIEEFIAKPPKPF